MAIADTISSMYENVGEVYDTITNVDLPTNKNIENIPSTIRKSYLDIMNNGIDTIYDNWEKVNGTGTSISLNNTEEAPMTIEYKGNTSQETTTGKNIWNLGSLSGTTQAGVTLTQDIDGGFLLNGTSTGVGRFKIALNTDINEVITLYLKSFNNSGDIMISLRDTNDTQLLSMRNDNVLKVYSYTPTAPIRYIELIQLTSGVQYTNYKIYPMIVKGSYTSSTIGDYEPYTNGASPNPNYPQDIHIVSGDNTITVCGKNISNWIQGNVNAQGQYVSSTTSVCTDFIKVNYNDIFTASKKELFTSSTNDNMMCRMFDKNKNIIGSIQALGRNQYSNSFTINNANCEYIRFAQFKSDGILVSNSYELMVEKGTTATTYEAYKGASYEINLGKNLFIPKPNNSTSAGITYSLNEDGTINLSGTSTNVIYFTFDKNVSESNFVNGNTYTFSSNKTIPSGVVYKIEIRSATSWLREYAISNSTPTRTFTIDLTDAVLIRYDIQVNNGTTPNLTNVGIQIEAGSSATSFSPYFTPIELCKIGTYKDRIFKSSGKNLVDVSNLSNVLITPSTGVETEIQSWRATDYNDSLKPNTTYCVSWVSSSDYFQVAVIYYDKNKNYLSGESLTTSGVYEKTFTTPSNFKYYRITYSVNVGGSSVTRNLIQIEQNTTRSSYEPYGKDWYLNKQIGKVVLDGSESGWSYPSTNRFNLDGLFNDYFKSAGNITYLSNYYKAFEQTSDNGTFNTLTTNTNYGFNLSSTTSNNYTIRFKDTRYTLIADFKSWLGSNNVSLYYALATPTYEKITGELLNQLEAIKNSYENQTNINQENNDLPFELEVGALKKY